VEKPQTLKMGCTEERKTRAQINEKGKGRKNERLYKAERRNRFTKGVSRYREKIKAASGRTNLATRCDALEDGYMSARKTVHRCEMIGKESKQAGKSYDERVQQSAPTARSGAPCGY